MSMKIKIAITTALLYAMMAAPGLAVVVVKRQGEKNELENQDCLDQCATVPGGNINRTRDIL